MLEYARADGMAYEQLPVVVCARDELKVVHNAERLVFAGPSIGPASKTQPSTNGYQDDLQSRISLAFPRLNQYSHSHLLHAQRIHSRPSGRHSSRRRNREAGRRIPSHSTRRRARRRIRSSNRPRIQRSLRQSPVARGLRLTSCKRHIETHGVERLMTIAQTRRLRTKIRHCLEARCRELAVGYTARDGCAGVIGGGRRGA